MRLTATAVLTAAILALVACTTKPGVSGLRRPNLIKAVVSLSPSTTEIYCSQTGCQGLVGRTSSCDYPPQVKNLKVVVDGTTPNYQLITQIHPDLILYDADLYGPAEIEKIKSLRQQTNGVQFLEFHPKTVDDLVAFHRELSTMMGTESSASTAVDKWLQEINNELGVAQSAKQKPTVAIIDLGGSVLAAGSKSLQADIYRRCGVTVVGPASDKFAEWNAEDLVKADPNAILSTVPLEKFKSDPRFANLRAVKNEDVIQVVPDVILRVGDRIETLLKTTVPRIAKAANR